MKQLLSRLNPFRRKTPQAPSAADPSAGRMPIAHTPQVEAYDRWDVDRARAKLPRSHFTKEHTRARMDAAREAEQKMTPRERAAARAMGWL